MWYPGLVGQDDVDRTLRRLLAGPSPLGKAAMRLQRYRVSPTRYVIPGKPYCDDPVQVNRDEARPAGGYVGLSLEMWAPCRRCAKCLLFRALKWRDRAIVEIEAAPRSWFVTLTFDPIHLAGVISESYRFSKLDRSAAVERAAFGHVQKYMKRLRKSGARFRYVAVPEWGEEHGRLHYHLLFHEAVEGSLTKRMIEGQWRSFVHARLVSRGEDTEGTPAGAARYVCKYLTKTLARPRASKNYGLSVP